MTPSNFTKVSHIYIVDFFIYIWLPHKTQNTYYLFTQIHTPSLQPDATVSEDIIVKVEEAEFIPLETIAPSPTLEESSQLATQSMRPLVCFSPFYLMSTNKQKGGREKGPVANYPLRFLIGYWKTRTNTVTEHWNNRTKIPDCTCIEYSHAH